MLFGCADVTVATNVKFAAGLFVMEAPSRAGVTTGKFQRRTDFLKHLSTVEQKLAEGYSQKFNVPQPGLTTRKYFSSISVSRPERTLTTSFLFITVSCLGFMSKTISNICLAPITFGNQTSLNPMILMPDRIHTNPNTALQGTLLDKAAQRP